MAATRLRRYSAFAYGLFAYLLGLSTVAYAVGFLANAFVPKSVDAGVTHSVGDPFVVNLTLVGLFGLQHSLMARPGFKAAWTRLVPKPIERSTYVLCASLALGILTWGWRPLPAEIWQTGGVLEPMLWGVFLGGWLLMFAAVFMIDGHRLLGLRQVTAYLRGRDPEPIDFQTPALYRFIRHPIMTGFLIAFWITPQMSVGHLLFAGGMTGYILVGLILEERDLVVAFGDQYGEYRAEVPMFIPRPWRSVTSSPDDANAD